MSKKFFSRRDFLKLAFTSLSTFLASCMPRVTQTPTPTPVPVSSKTNTPETTPTETQTSTPSETPTPTEIPCFHLLTPENGTKLPAIGKVHFSWEPMPGAASYQLQFTFPSGLVISFDAKESSNTRYIESFLAGGTYTWQIVALESNGSLICITDPFTFEKPAHVQPRNKEDEDGNSSDGSGSTSSGALSSGSWSSGSDQ